MDGISIKVDASDVMRSISQLANDDAPYVLAVALTRTAQQIQRVEYQVMGQVFDRPTPFTLNSLYVQPATKREPTAVVQFKEGFGSVPAWRYLGPEVAGGARGAKSFELALQRAGLLKPGEKVVPGAGAKLDSYGNMRGGDLAAILSQLKASPDPSQNATGSRRSRAARTKGRYFVSRDRGIPAGVYLAGSGRSITPVLLFVSATVYGKRFPFYETGRDVFASGFVANARAVWAEVAARFKRTT